jgi:hypothetical protein
MRQLQALRIISGWRAPARFPTVNSPFRMKSAAILRILCPITSEALIDYADGVYTRFGAPETVHGRNNPRSAKCLRGEPLQYPSRALPGAAHGVRSILHHAAEHVRRLAETGFTFMELTTAKEYS